MPALDQATISTNGAIPDDVARSRLEARVDCPGAWLSAGSSPALDFQLLRSFGRLARYGSDDRPKMLNQPLGEKLRRDPPFRIQEVRHICDPRIGH